MSWDGTWTLRDIPIWAFCVKHKFKLRKIHLWLWNNLVWLNLCHDNIVMVMRTIKDDKRRMRMMRLVIWQCGHWWTTIEQQGQCWRMKGMVVLVMEDEGDDKDRNDNGCDMWGQHWSIGEVGSWDGTKGMMRDVKGYDKKYEWWKKMGDVRDGDGKEQGWQTNIRNDGDIYYGQCDHHPYFHKILPIYSYCHLISMFFLSLLNFHDTILTLSSSIVVSYHSSNQSHCFKDVWQHLIKGDVEWKHPNLEVWWMLGPFSPPQLFVLLIPFGTLCACIKSITLFDGLIFPSF